MTVTDEAPTSTAGSALRRWFVPAWGGRSFSVLFAARVAMSAARALAGVVVPVYLALQGFTGFTLGLLFFGVALFSAVLSSSVGLTSDRVGRKVFLVSVPLLAAFAAAVFAVTTWVPALVAMAVVGSFGRGAGAGAGAVGPYQPVESAMVTDTTPAARRNDAFGRLAFGSSGGALVGSLFALLADGHHLRGAATLAAFRPAFVAAAVLAAVAGLLALALEEVPRPVRLGAPGGPTGARGAPDGEAEPIGAGEPVLPVDAGDVVEVGGTVAQAASSGTVSTVGEDVVAGRGQPGAPPSASSGTGPSTAGTPSGPPRRWGMRFPHRSRPLLVRLWATNGVNGLAVGMIGPFVTYWLYRRYGVGVGEIGILYSVINLATMPSTLSAAGLARRFGLVRTVTAVRVAQAVLLVPMVLAPTFALAGAAYLLRMVVQRIGLPLRQSYVLAMADPDERASVAALANLPSQAAMAASPVLSGYLFDNVSLELPFELGAALQLVNAVLFWVFFHGSAPEEERQRPP
ncbi:MAG: MFS transporter [Actinomycetota bacterium]|nr:MFS transporter [Actinomycetota bacterium]